MKSFFDYSKIKMEEKKEAKTEQKQDPKLEEIASKYSNMSQSELMSNLVSEVAKQKQNGTFDIKKIENTIDNMGSYLSNEQKKNIKELLKQFR